jgi:hypothetical protein
MWYIYTRKYYSDTKNEIMLFAEKWNWTTSKLPNLKKVKGHMFSLICGNYTHKLHTYKYIYDSIDR